jgi:DUF1009 family protein
VIAVEAGVTLVLDRQRVMEKAASQKITLYGIADPAGTLPC